MTEQEAMFEAIGYHSGNGDVSMYETPRLAVFGELVWKSALKWAKTQQEPVAWVFQHEERGDIDYVCPQQVEWGYEKNNSRWQKTRPVFSHPAPAPDVSELVEALRNLLTECDCFTKQYPHMEKGYMIDAKEIARQALAKWEGK